MPLKLNLFERIGILHYNYGPGPMLDMLGALSFKAVTTALELEIFDKIGVDKKNLNELSADIEADEKGLSLLLEALVHLGYITKVGDTYSNSPMTAKWMLSKSPHGLTNLFGHFSDMLHRWDNLQQSIKQGRPVKLGKEWLDEHPGSWDRYHAGLRETARLLCREIVSKAGIKNSHSRLLDLGGGHGQYSIEFCRRYPSLTADVYDFEDARKNAENNISDEEMGGRVRFIAGDFNVDPIGTGYDLVLLINVIRIFTPEDIVPFLNKIRGSLNRNGMIIIVDNMGLGSGSPFISANYSLILLELYNSTIGVFHDASDINTYLIRSGFTGIRKKKLHRSPGLTMITAGASD